MFGFLSSMFIKKSKEVATLGDKPEVERDEKTGKEVKFLLPETLPIYYRLKAEYKAGIESFFSARKAEYDRLMGEAEMLDVEPSESPAANELRRREAERLRCQANKLAKDNKGEGEDLEHKLWTLLETLRREELKKILAEGEVLYTSSVNEGSSMRNSSSSYDWDRSQRKLVKFRREVFLVVLVQKAKTNKVGQMEGACIYAPAGWYIDEDLTPSWGTKSVSQMTDDELRAII